MRTAQRDCRKTIFWDRAQSGRLTKRPILRPGTQSVRADLDQRPKGVWTLPIVCTRANRVRVHCTSTLDRRKTIFWGRNPKRTVVQAPDSHPARGSIGQRGLVDSAPQKCGILPILRACATRENRVRVHCTSTLRFERRVKRCRPKKKKPRRLLPGSGRFHSVFLSTLATSYS